jgi:hypothetical protein
MTSRGVEIAEHDMGQASGAATHLWYSRNALNRANGINADLYVHHLKIADICGNIGFTVGCAS